MSLVYGDADRRVPSLKYPHFGGFVFYAFSEQWEEQEAIMEVCRNELTPEMQAELEFVLAGRGDLISILWGANNYFTGFEIEEPFKMAENFQALLLPHLGSEALLDGYQNDRVQFFEFLNAKPKVLQFPLKEEDMGPIDEKCGCFACTEHTRRYISHLLECKEMNCYVRSG